jgi:hypothetical protein
MTKLREQRDNVSAEAAALLAQLRATSTPVASPTLGMLTNAAALLPPPANLTPAGSTANGSPRAIDAVADEIVATSPDTSSQQQQRDGDASRLESVTSQQLRAALGELESEVLAPSAALVQAEHEGQADSSLAADSLQTGARTVLRSQAQTEAKLRAVRGDLKRVRHERDLLRAQMAALLQPSEIQL